MKRFLIFCLVSTASLLGGLFSYVAWKAYDSPPRLNTPAPLTSIIIPDPVLGFDLRPNLVDYHSTNLSQFWIYTNKNGVRVSRRDESHLQHADIITLGDSQSFGYAIDNTKTFTSHLSKRFGVPVANLAVPGHGSLAALYRLDRFGHLKPRIIIYGIFYDSFDRSLNRCYPGFSLLCISGPYLEEDRTDGFRVVPPGDNKAAISATAGYLRYMTSAPADQNFTADFGWSLGKVLDTIGRATGLVETYRKEFPEGVYIRSAEFTISLANRRANEMGAQLVLLFIPNYFVTPIQPVPRFLVRIAKDLDLSLIDATPALVEIKNANPDNPKVLEVPGDGHLTAEAHFAISNLIAKYIQEAKLLDRAR